MYSSVRGRRGNNAPSNDGDATDAAGGPWWIPKRRDAAADTAIDAAGDAATPGALPSKRMRPDREASVDLLVFSKGSEDIAISAPCPPTLVMEQSQWEEEKEVAADSVASTASLDEVATAVNPTLGARRERGQVLPRSLGRRRQCRRCVDIVLEGLDSTSYRSLRDNNYHRHVLQLVQPVPGVACPWDFDQYTVIPKLVDAAWQRLFGVMAVAAKRHNAIEGDTLSSSSSSHNNNFSYDPSYNNAGGAPPPPFVINDDEEWAADVARRMGPRRRLTRSDKDLDAMLRIPDTKTTLASAFGNGTVAHLVAHFQSLKGHGLFVEPLAFVAPLLLVQEMWESYQEVAAKATTTTAPPPRIWARHAQRWYFVLMMLAHKGIGDLPYTIDTFFLLAPDTIHGGGAGTSSSQQQQQQQQQSQEARQYATCAANEPDDAATTNERAWWSWWKVPGLHRATSSVSAAVDDDDDEEQPPQPPTIFTARDAAVFEAQALRALDYNVLGPLAAFSDRARGTCFSTADRWWTTTSTEVTEPPPPLLDNIVICSGQCCGVPAMLARMSGTLLTDDEVRYLVAYANRYSRK